MYLSPGNRKMKIPTWSLPSITSCPNSTKLCEEYCYANKAEIQYPNVSKSRITNLMDSACPNFVKNLSDIISRRKSEYIRIHESGDFYNQSYLNKWFKICKNNPNKKFLAYTQTWDLDWRGKPNNLIIYWSVWPDTIRVPIGGLKAYVIDNGKGKIPKHNRTYKGYHCKKTKVKGLTCDQCLWCFKGKGDVIFEIH